MEKLLWFSHPLKYYRFLGFLGPEDASSPPRSTQASQYIQAFSISNTPQAVGLPQSDAVCRAE